MSTAPSERAPAIIDLDPAEGAKTDGIGSEEGSVGSLEPESQVDEFGRPAIWCVAAFWGVAHPALRERSRSRSPPTIATMKCYF